jgi:hypothetical protein
LQEQDPRRNGFREMQDRLDEGERIHRAHGQREHHGGGDLRAADRADGVDHRGDDAEFATHDGEDVSTCWQGSSTVAMTPVGALSASDKRACRAELRREPRADVGEPGAAPLDFAKPPPLSATFTFSRPSSSVARCRSGRLPAAVRAHA